MERIRSLLTEEKKGGRENLTAILAPAKAKSHIGVNFREHDGTKYSEDLKPKSEERDVTLHFAIFAPTREAWLSRYRAFIKMLKEGEKGWLAVTLPSLGLTMTMFYLDSTSFKPRHTCGQRECMPAVLKSSSASRSHHSKGGIMPL